MTDLQAPFRRIQLEKYAALLVLILLLVISSILSPYFLQIRNLLNILRQVSYTGIIGLGMTFVIIAGGIDLSVGSMAAFLGAIAIIVMNAMITALGGETAAIAVAIAATLAGGLLAGALNGLLVTKGRIAPFIVTLGTLAIFRSLSLYIGNAGEFRSNSNRYADLGAGALFGIPVPVIVMLLLAAVLSLALNSTRYGRYISAVGSNPRVAMFSAIDVDRVRFFTYVITGLTVAVSAVLLSMRFNAVSSANTGLGFELDAIAAVIIGGTSMVGGRGTIWGTVVGAVIIGVINNMLNMLGISPYLQGTVKGLVIIGAVYLQRQRQS